VNTKKSVRQNAAFEKGLELLFDEPGQAGAGPGLDLGEEPLEMFPHQAMPDRLLRAPPLVLDRVRGRGAQHGFALQSHSEANARTTFAGHRDLAGAEKSPPQSTTDAARALKKRCSGAQVGSDAFDRPSSVRQAAIALPTPTQSSTTLATHCCMALAAVIECGNDSEAARLYLHRDRLPHVTGRHQANCSNVQVDHPFCLSAAISAPATLTLT